MIAIITALKTKVINIFKGIPMRGKRKYRFVRGIQIKYYTSANEGNDDVF